MIKSLKDINQLLKTKSIIFLPIIIGIVCLVIYTIQILYKPPLYKKLQGEYNIDLEQSYIYRHVDFRPLGSNIVFNNAHVELPAILSAHDKIKGTYEDIKRLENNAKGKWKIISKKPDSILIETPASLLNGKYAVILKKKVIPPQIIYYLIIQNDSTYLCSSKVCSVLNKLTLSQSKRSKNLCLITMNQRKYCYYISM